MKKTGVILTAAVLLCALLISCGTDVQNENTTLPAVDTTTLPDTVPDGQNENTTLPAVDTTTLPDTVPDDNIGYATDILVSAEHVQTEELVYEYLSALPTVGEETPEPQILVVQSYDQLRAVYEAADACEDDEMGVKGSWENIGSSDKFYQTYFDKHFAVVVLMVTDDGYYDLRLDCEDSEEGISLKVFGVRSYEQPTIRERHVFFCSFEGKYEGQSISLDVSYTPYASQIEQNIYTYYTYGNSEIPSKPYFVVQSYEELLQVYECASQKPRDYGSYSLGIKGNWSEAKKNNLYNEQFFENNYIVVAMTQTGSGSYDFDCTHYKQDGKIVIELDGALPYVSTADIGSFMFLCPFEGKYEGESIEIISTSVQYNSRIQQAIEIKFGPRPILDNANGFYEQEHLVIYSYEELCELYKYAAVDPSTYNSELTHIGGNWQEAQQNNSYEKQFFDNRCVIAVMTVAHSNSTFDIKSEKNGNDITVYVHENAHVNNEKNAGYIHLIHIEQYNWLHDKVTIERSIDMYKSSDE